MCKRIFGVPLDAGSMHPCDPDDLSRCLLFLDAVKAQDKVLVMSDVSPAWVSLVKVWERLTVLFNEEKLMGKSAPKTYALMREAIRESEEAALLVTSDKQREGV